MGRMRERELIKVSDLLESIVKTFQKSPFGFFTEHDLHSELYHAAISLLDQRGGAPEVTRDKFNVKLVHHKYPTPFRCDMRGSHFQVKGDNERTEKGGKFRRGHIDLVVLNPTFVSKNDLAVVTGKNYQLLKGALRSPQPTVLNLALEVIYFPPVRKIPERGPAIVKQDCDKLVALRSCLLADENPFCHEAATIVFTSRKKKENQRLKTELQKLEWSPEIALYILDRDETVRIT